MARLTFGCFGSAGLKVQRKMLARRQASWRLVKEHVFSSLKLLHAASNCVSTSSFLIVDAHSKMQAATDLYSASFFRCCISICNVMCGCGKQHLILLQLLLFYLGEEVVEGISKGFLSMRFKQFYEVSSVWLCLDQSMSTLFLN